MIINPIEYPNWNNLLLTNQKSSFFHTSEWAKMIVESYNYQPLYFIEIDNDQLTALIPLMEIKSLLTGKRGVSLPFTDQCTIIASDKKQFHKLFEKLIEYGKKAKWKAIEMRGGSEYLENEIPSAIFLTHMLDLEHSEEKIFASFRSSTRRNIKKAVKKSVQVDILNTINSIQEFYRLNCLTRKDHGLPPQPFSFFEKIYEHIISAKKGFVVLGSYNNRVIAGAVYCHFKDKAIFKYGASDKTYNHIRPNNLVMWEAIKKYRQNGCKSFNFGRTEPHHEGLLQFKRGWGTTEKTIHYYKHDLAKDVFVKESLRLKSSYFFLRKMPLPLLKLIGRILYRHVG